MRQIKARDLQVGMVVIVPGVELHDDLSGLEVHLSVRQIERGHGRTRVFDPFSQSWTAWKNDEDVNVAQGGA